MVAMRVLIAALAISLAATRLAAAQVTSPLASGQAAGLEKARNASDIIARYVVYVGAIALIVIVAYPATGTSGTATSTTGTSQ